MELHSGHALENEMMASLCCPKRQFVSTALHFEMDGYRRTGNETLYGQPWIVLRPADTGHG